jgi:ubiquinone/menaquinone biosynthesis C-methylase UbiE
MSPAVQAIAEALPFKTCAFDVALAVLTLHHWSDWRMGLAEMKRVATRVVIFTFDPDALGNFWLTQTYFPEIIELDRKRSPSIGEMVEELGDCRVESGAWDRRFGHLRSLNALDAGYRLLVR